MTRITKSKREKIVRHFLDGTSMIKIHHDLKVDLPKIEDIIRQAMKAGEEQS
jgi:hypothetical protein